MQLALIDIWGETDVLVEESTQLPRLLQVWWEEFFDRFEPGTATPEQARQDLQAFLEARHLVCYPHSVYHV